MNDKAMNDKAMNDRINWYQSFVIEASNKGEDKDEAEQLARQAMRYLCRNDLFYLMVYALKRTDMMHPWLFERCMDIQNNPDGFLDLWAREHYKALPLDTIVPTPSGYKEHGDLEIGDKVFGSDGKPVSVVAKTEVYKETPCYKIIFNDGTEIVAGRDHLWVVGEKYRETTGKRKTGRRDVVVSTEDIFNHNHKPDNRYSLDMDVVVDMPNKQLQLDPYTFGVWLGDGNSDGPRITCHYDDIQIIDEVRKCYPVKENKSSNKNTGLFAFGNGIKGKKGTGVRPILKTLNVLGNKHIPIDYLRGSIDQRLSLLQGLMDTDGHNSTRGTSTFVNNNERLVDDVFELCGSLGLNPKKYTHHIDVNGEDYPVYKVAFQSYIDYPVFRLERKLNRSKKSKPTRRKFIVDCVPVESVPVSCIQVGNEDGIYLINKDYTPTHNSTIITYGKTIQDILVNPEITIGIFSHTKSIARGFLKQIRYELEQNEFLKELFPDILYEKPRSEAIANGVSWSDEKGICVKRLTNPKEMTVEAHGLVDGQPTGKHFNLLIYDDIVTLESVSTPEQIEKTTNALLLSYNLGAHGGSRRFIGTRYHSNDTYSDIMDKGTVIPRIHPAIKKDGKPAFLEQKKLDEKRRDFGPYVFNCQMMQNPLQDNLQGFDKQWKRFYRGVVNSNDMNKYILVDPANEKKKTNDYTAMFVVGLSSDNNYYVLDMVRDRLNLSERTELLFDLHKQYNPIATGFEKYGMQSDIQHVEYVMDIYGYHFNIIPLGGSMPKNDRIKQLIPVFEQGRMWFPENHIRINHEGMQEDLTRIFFKFGYDTFPVCQFDDQLDCLARIVDPTLKARFPVRGGMMGGKPRQKRVFAR